MKDKEMKVLNLIIKQKYFDLIMAGAKVQEFREVRPTNIGRLVQQEPDEYGTLFEVCDEYGNALPIEYDAIRFYVGYNKDRDSALVEVKDAYCEVFLDDNDEVIIYEHGVDKHTGEPLQWTAMQVVYNLGKILETNIHPKHKK